MNHPVINKPAAPPIVAPYYGASQLQTVSPVQTLVSAEEPSPDDKTCWNCGEEFKKGHYVCESCRSIKPIARGHQVDPAQFQWAQDGKAMAKLRSIGPLVSIAKTVSQKVGRPWIEATFNGVRLSYRQMPQVYAMSVQAARILGLKKMPVVYVSGTRPWDALTFGSDDDAFIVIGSALVSCFQKSELMFLIAREMGHILAGHALWKTVIQFLVGEQNPKAGMMKNGVAGLLDPARWLESAIELPLLGWARQSEITADRAGLLAAASLDQARKVLLSWSLKSPMLYQQINIDAWLEQQDQDSNDESIRLAELVSSSTPYITRRLKLMNEFEASPQVSQFRSYLMQSIREQVQKNQQAIESSSSEPALETPEQIQIPCAACQSIMKLDSSILATNTKLAVKCPNANCEKVQIVKSKSAIQSHESAQKNEQNSFQNID